MTSSGSANAPGDDQVALKLSGHVGQWARAVDLQRQRIHQDDGILDRQIDAILLAASVRNLLRAATAVANLGVGGAMADAFEKFHALVPQADAIRNALEHFDEYEEGRGRMQRSGRMQEYHIFYERSDTSYRLHVENLVIDVDVAADAALKLAEATLDHVDRVVNTEARKRRGEPALDYGTDSDSRGG